MATPNNFRVKNGLTAANGVTVTTGNVVISNGQLIVNGTAINSTSISQSANNAYANAVNYADGKAADAYGNAVAVATGSSTNAYNNAVAFAANADNLTSGTLSLNRLPATVNVSVALNVTNTVSISTSNVTVSQANDVAKITGTAFSLTDSLTETGNTYYAAMSHDKLITEKTYVVANVIYADYGEISRTGMFATVGLNTTNSSIYVRGVTVNTSVIAIGNTTVFSTINSTAFSGNGASLTSVNAATVGGNSASDLRTYAETYASNATNITSGTVNSARLPSANDTTAGAVILVNSVTNTSITAAASANSVKTAYDAAIAANTAGGTAAATAYSNGVTYTDNKAANAYSNAIAIAANATNLTSGTVNIALIPTVDAVNNTSITLIPVANNVKTAYDAAITANTNAASALANAATAYTNAIAIAANATNLTSGTVNSARLPSANATVAGATLLVDSVSNTSPTAAASANSVKTAYDAAIAANTLANTAATSATSAYSNAVTYTDTLIGTANTAMVANAGAAYTNAIAIAANATNLTSGTVALARLPTVDAINNTSITLIPVANNVKTAYDAAITANTNAQTALTAAGSAYSNGVTYTDTKIGTANTAMAANAAAAYSNAVSYADTRASTAYSNAITFAANASNANNGTLAEARLPFRMNQAVRTTDSPTFANGTFTGSVTVGGDITVTGNLTTVNVSSLSIADPIIKLGVNNAGDALFGGLTFHYNGSGNTTNHAGLVRSPSSKEFFLMSTYGDEALIGNNQINVADPSFTYANLQLDVLKSGNSTVNTTINSTAMLIGTTFTANSTGLFVGNSTVNTIVGVVPGGGSFTTLLTQGNANDSVYSVVTNSNTGSNASADFAIYDSSGITGGNFIDMGILSSGWSNAGWTINGPSDGYLYTSNSNLSIGTAGAKYLSFFAGGTLATNEAMRITGANVGVGNTNPNAKFQVTGTANVSGAVNFGSTFAAGNTTITGNISVSSVGSFDRVTTANNGSGTNIAIGDDAWFGDVNIADSVRIMGQQSANNAYIIFGNADNSVKLGRAGTGALTWNGAFSVTGGLTTLSANLVMANNNITNPTLTGYTESEISNTAVTGTYSLNCVASNFWDLTLTGNTTISPTGVPSATKMWAGTIAAKQDATGGRTITWPTGSKYPGGVVPPATTTANAIDIWSLMTYDGGTSWIVSLTVKGAA